MPKVKSVRAGSLAEELEIEPGDDILAINGQTIQDIVDLQFALAGEELTLEVRKVSGEEWELETEKAYDELLGVEFDHPTLDRVRLCHNKCV
ncbi:MAG: PDZ domain-containing protein, partial [Firmicutes bacterium]|nr:PDZ domain-containing protein [Bacillota bacterium]